MANFDIIINFSS